MNNTKRKKLYRLNLATQKQAITVPEQKVIVQQVQEKAIKFVELPVALKELPEEVREESKEEVLVQEEKKEEEISTVDKKKSFVKSKKVVETAE